MSNTVMTFQQAKDKTAQYAITQGKFNTKRNNTFKRVRSARASIQELLNHAMYFIVTDFNTAPLSALVKDIVSVNTLKSKDVMHWIYAATGGLSEYTLALKEDSTLITASPKDSIVTWDKEKAVFKVKKLPKDTENTEDANKARIERLTICAARMAEVNYWELSRPKMAQREYEFTRFISAVRTAFNADNFNGLSTQEQAMLNEVNDVLLKYGVDYNKPIKRKEKADDTTTKVDKTTKAKEVTATRVRPRNRRATSEQSTAQATA